MLIFFSLPKKKKKKQVTLLLREGLVLYGLSHTALLPVLGVSIEDRSAPFLLYPHTGYRNMKRFLLRCKLTSEGPPRALTTQEVVEMALQAAKGIQYLHRKRLVHKDLATRNCVYVRMTNHRSRISPRVDFQSSGRRVSYPPLPPFPVFVRVTQCRQLYKFPRVLLNSFYC